MPSLYRIHRPQRWEDISGQTALKRTLQQEIKDNRLVNAYLFEGPRGVGKTSIARIFAKSINCPKRGPGESEPCNSCDICKEITAGSSLDILEIDAASHTGVDNVRETVIENARFAPSKTKYKVFIIDEVHMLSISAFNALLKIIEEPPAHVIFILATTELEKVPETIVSRCQRFDFKKISHQEIILRLKHIAQEEKISVADEVYERIARQSEGCARDAESLLGQLFSLGESSITSEMADLTLPRFYTEHLSAFVDTLLKKDISGSLDRIQTLSQEGVDLMMFHDQFIEYLRILMITKFNPELARVSFHLNDENLDQLKKLAERISTESLTSFLDNAVEAKKWWKNVRITEIPLELMTLKITRASTENTHGVQKTNDIQRQVAKPATTPTTATVEKQGEQPSGTLPIGVITTGKAHISLDEIKKKWNDLLKRVQTYHHSLPVILRMSEPIEVVGNVIRIGLKYTFHRDKIKERKMSELVERALKDVMGITLFIDAIMIETAELIPVKETNQAIELNDLIQTFGGQVAPSI